jgi:hypothetical protein
LCAAAAPGGARPGAPAPRIVALGDSLTSGRGIGAANAYPALLQTRIEERGLDFQTAQARGISVLLCGMEALPMFGWD